MTTLSLRTVVRNAAAVFSGAYGTVTRRAQEAGCSRQTLYQHARQIEQRLQPTAPTLASATPPAESPAPTPTPTPTPTPVLDEPTRRRLAVTAFAMGISTRQIEDLLRVIDPEHAPDHSTIARWVAQEAEKAQPVLQALDRACQDQVQTLAVDEVFFGGGRPWSASNRGA